MKKALTGVVLVEALIALAIFAVIADVGLQAYRLADRVGGRAAEREKALLLAEEGIEAARAMRDANFADLTAGTKGIALSSNAWTFSGTSDYTDGYQRTVTIAAPDTDTRLATSSVSWSSRGATTTVELATTLTNWRKLAGTGASATTINTSGACVYTLDTRYLAGVSLVNDGSAGTVSVTQIQVSWNPVSGRSITQIFAPYPTAVWTGSASSGSTLTLSAPIIFTSAGTRNLAFLWNASMSGRDFTLTFTFSDGSTKTATITSPLLSLCL